MTGFTEEHPTTSCNIIVARGGTEGMEGGREREKRRRGMSTSGVDTTRLSRFASSAATSSVERVKY